MNTTDKAVLIALFTRGAIQNHLVLSTPSPLFVEMENGAETKLMGMRDCSEFLGISYGILKYGMKKGKNILGWRIKPFEGEKCLGVMSEFAPLVMNLGLSRDIRNGCPKMMTRTMLENIEQLSKVETSLERSRLYVRIGLDAMHLWNLERIKQVSEENRQNEE